MNKQFTQPTDFEIHYNAQEREANFCWYEGKVRKGFHIKNLEIRGINIETAWFDEHPTFRLVGKCISIRTEGDKTIIE